MRNKVLVVLIVLLCVWLTLEGPAAKRAKRRANEDESDDQSAKSSPSPPESSKKISAKEQKSPRK